MNPAISRLARPVTAGLLAVALASVPLAAASARGGPGGGGGMRGGGGEMHEGFGAHEAPSFGGGAIPWYDNHSGPVGHGDYGHHVGYGYGGYGFYPFFFGYGDGGNYGNDYAGNCQNVLVKHGTPAHRYYQQQTVCS